MIDGENSVTFNRQGPEFMCFGGRIHVTFGSLLIACFSLILCAFELLSVIVLFGNIGIVNILYVFLLAVSSTLLLIGLKSERKGFLVPYIIFSVVSILFCVAAAFFSIWMLTSPFSTPSVYLLVSFDTIEYDHWKSFADDDQLVHRAEIVSRIFGASMLLLSLFLVPAILYTSRIVYQTYIFFEKLNNARCTYNEEKCS